MSRPDSLDFTVGAFAVHDRHVLLVRHHKLNTWICPGGHVDPGEDPEEAIHREFAEEVGISIALVGERESVSDWRSKFMVRPRFMDTHPITAAHRHCGIFYLARPLSCEIGGEYKEAHGWFSAAALPDLDMWPATRHYATVAIKELS